MRRLVVFVAIAVGLAVGSVVPVGAASGSASVATSSSANAPVVDVCGPVPAGYARCLSKAARGGVAGYTPRQIKAAYNFPTGKTVGAGQLIVIVTAFDAPTIEADLKKFSKRFSLPLCTSVGVTVAERCFDKVLAAGVPPPVDASWAQEASLDVEWAHAIAPGARIRLVEAASNGLADLFFATSVATTLAEIFGGHVVSHSWGTAQFPGQEAFEPLLTGSPGVTNFVASGDFGFPGAYPAASPNVIAVGGTRLQLNDGKFSRETGWFASGGGCSFQDASAAQAAFAGYTQVNCGGKRAFPDVSMTADVIKGVAVYDSTPFAGVSGWSVLGGTSAATPIIAARAAATGVVVDQAYIYGNNIAYRDITKGNNGTPARPGFDLVTGRGSWTG